MSKRSRRNFIKTTAALGAGFAAPWMWRHGAPADAKTVVNRHFTAPILDPEVIPRFVDALPIPGANWPLLTGPSHQIALKRVQCQALPQNAPGFPKLETPCWGYRASSDYGHTYLGPTVVGIRGVETTLTFDYKSIDPRVHILRTGNASRAKAASVVDKTLHGTNRREPEARFIAHKHGSIGVDEKSDGYSESWVTPDGKTIATYDSATSGQSPVGYEQGSDLRNATMIHHYPNLIGASLVWYHDHALGITRLNVYAGMAGAFVVTDDNEAELIRRGILPTLGGRFDVPLVIQDRAFYPDGSWAYPDQPAPGRCAEWPGGPSTLAEFFADCMLVNGKTWPVFDVEPSRYRLRFINGCNARFLDLAMDRGGSFGVIGTEGGFLPVPVIRGNVLMGPAERFDAIFDFRPFAGQTLTMINRAKKPFPAGAPPVANLDGAVMQFRVKPALTGAAEVTASLPARIHPGPAPYEKRDAAAATRGVLLFEGADKFGRAFPTLGQVMGNSKTGLSAMPLMWGDPVTEKPRTGSVEIWEIYNTTPDAHPIHLHDVLFSVMDRQPIRFEKSDAMSACRMPMKTFPIQIEGQARASELYERGFKDTAIAHPAEVTRIVVDFAHAKPGRFAWHCHILEHEDHEMMRPYDVVA
ncbi:MAG TPA: multicopper oxidase domain-containing protein [Terriglobia bacterium]|nr:multicopper oxidase domain-containing protein [Terriglobia bacterium]